MSLKRLRTADIEDKPCCSCQPVLLVPLSSPVHIPLRSSVTSPACVPRVWPSRSAAPLSTAHAQLAPKRKEYKVEFKHNHNKGAGSSPWLPLWSGMVSHWLSGHFLEYLFSQKFLQQLKKTLFGHAGVGSTSEYFPHLKRH